MAGLKISPQVLAKLAAKHRVTREEVEECFSNRYGGMHIDTRERHQTTPPTKWFVAPTDRQRILKIICMLWPVVRESGKQAVDAELKSAFDADSEVQSLYERLELAKRIMEEKRK